MLRQLGLKIDDLRELRVKPVTTWCTSHSDMARAKASRTRITTSQSKLLPSRRRRIKMGDEGCFVCSSLDHWAKKCLKRKGRKLQPE
jgi:hypothetical protein